MSSPFHMRLERNDDFDCYILYPCGHIATAEDIQCFTAEYVRLFGPLGRRVDVVIVLDMFTVAPGALETWSLARRDMVERYTNISVRASSGGNLGFFLKKNEATNSAYNDYADDIPSAIERLQQKRRSQGRVHTKSA